MPICLLLRGLAFCCLVARLFSSRLCRVAYRVLGLFCLFCIHLYYFSCRLIYHPRGARCWACGRLCIAQAHYLQCVASSAGELLRFAGVYISISTYVQLSSPCSSISIISCHVFALNYRLLRIVSYLLCCWPLYVFISGEVGLPQAWLWLLDFAFRPQICFPRFFHSSALFNSIVSAVLCIVNAFFSGRQESKLLLSSPPSCVTMPLTRTRCVALLRNGSNTGCQSGQPPISGHGKIRWRTT